jgi:sugar lactone lactonase YvrE
MAKIVLFKLGEQVATAAAAVNVTEARLSSKAIVSSLAIAAKNVESVGGMCVDNSGNIYVSDDQQHVIVKVTESGQITTFAGLAGTAGNNASLQNVTAANARFNQPKGLACDNSGNIYVADYGNNQIRIIKNGKVSVYAGNGATLSGLVDAAANPLQARFSHPSDVAVDASGVVYVADTDNHAIRKIWGATVLTIAGNGSVADAENVKASKNTPFCDSPVGIAVDKKGTVFVCDTGNDKIKKITPNGWIYLHSGSGSSGNSLGTGATKAYTCEYQGPKYIAVDSYGYQYVTDVAATGSRLVKINPNGIPSNIVDFSAATTSDPGVIGVAVSPAGKVFVSITTAADMNSSSSSESSESEGNVSSSSSSSDSSSSDSSDSSSSDSSDSSSSDSSDSSSSSSEGFSTSSSSTDVS